MRKPRPNNSRMAVLHRVRTILGNQGAIRTLYANNKPIFAVGTDDGQFHTVSVGRDWDDAIANIPKEVA